MKASALPRALGTPFTTRAAQDLGVARSRLRSNDLEAPFRGVRMLHVAEEDPTDRYQAALDRELSLIRALTCNLDSEQFFCHRSAAILWELPVPFRSSPELHLGVLHPQRSPRYREAVGHCFRPSRVQVTRHGELPVLTPASTFATLGQLPLPQLVAAGDRLIRMYRPGIGRRQVGRCPIATLKELEVAIAQGRWRGAPNLRRALELIRPDSWSPQESVVRVALVLGGLPEPELNVDVFDDDGRFLACVDMIYRRYRIIVEYQGEQHRETFAKDVERFDRLRSEGWEVILVTGELARYPELLVQRVGKALIARGWRG